MTTYYERRRLLNEIRALNNNDSSDHPSAPPPIHVSKVNYGHSFAYFYLDIHQHKHARLST